MLSLALALLAGSLTTLSPCVLPILPIVLFGALDQHRFGPLALAGGLVLTFGGLGVLLSGVSWALDIPDTAIRYTAAGFLIVFGMVLLSTALQTRFAVASSPLTDTFHRMLDRVTPRGLWGQFGLGVLLGAVWTPCSGPTLGAAIGLAANSDTLAKAGAVMLLFGVGASLPLLAIAYGSRQTLKTRRIAMARISQAAKPWLGVLLVAAGVLVVSGFDKTLESAFASSMPDWLVRLTTRF
ncbi:MAG: cytochrome c biogenesis CcdA family protein [Novosphingobium sp.]